MIDWYILFRLGRNPDLVTFWGGALVDCALFDIEDPEGEESVEDGVEGDGEGGVSFCGLEAEVVVPGEASGGEGERGEAEGEADVGEEVGGGEGEGGEVVGDGVVGGVFEVWNKSD